jgi:hypothetical protein
LVVPLGPPLPPHEGGKTQLILPIASSLTFKQSPYPLLSPFALHFFVLSLPSSLIPLPRFRDICRICSVFSPSPVLQPILRYWLFPFWLTADR